MSVVFLPQGFDTYMLPHFCCTSCYNVIYYIILQKKKKSWEMWALNLRLLSFKSVRWENAQNKRELVKMIQCNIENHFKPIGNLLLIIYIVNQQKPSISIFIRNILLKITNHLLSTNLIDFFSFLCSIYWDRKIFTWYVLNSGATILTCNTM